MSSLFLTPTNIIDFIDVAKGNNGTLIELTITISDAGSKSLGRTEKLSWVLFMFWIGRVSHKKSN